MWRFIITIGVLLALAACGQTEHEIQPHQAREMVKGNPDEYPYKVEGELFSGLLFANNDDGQRIIELELKEGLPTGHLRRWADNGQIVLDADAIRGEDGALLKNKYETWARNGTRTELQDYNDEHKLVAHKRWREDGTLVTDDRFNDEGQPVAEKSWHADGKPEKTVDYDDAGHVTLAKFWCYNDQKGDNFIRQERRSEQGERTVIIHRNCATGRKISEKQYAPGESTYSANADLSSPNGFKYGFSPDGLEQTWWPNGKPKMRAHYSDGQKDGLEETFHYSGQKEKVAHWKNGEGVGEFREWYANGKPKTDGRYTDAGEKTGLWQTWTKEGERSVEDYERDAYVMEKYLRPFGQALTSNRRDFSPDKSMYYIENDLVKADAKLPARSNGSSINYYAANEWPKKNWTYPIIVANKALIKPLLAAGADINAANSQGATRLLICASHIGGRYCDIDELKTILDAGAKVSVANASGRTALHEVAGQSSGFRGERAQQDAAMKALIDAGAPVNAKDATGDTALMYALAVRRADFASQLLDAGAKVDIENDKHRQAIHYVFLTGPRSYTIRDDEFVRTMLKKLTDAGANLNAKMDWDGEQVTIHDLAVREGAIGLAKYMETMVATQ